MAEEAALDRNAYRAAMLAAAGFSRDLPATAAALARWLEGKLGSRVEVSELSVPQGAGLANETLLFDATYSKDGERRTQGLVLRVKPTAVQLFPDPDFEGLTRLLQTLRDKGLVKTPHVLWVEDDPSIVGAPFFVMAKLAARTPVSHPNYNVSGWLAEATPEQRRVTWTTAVEGLASVHRVPGELVEFIGWPQFGKTGEDQQIGYWEYYARWCGFPIPDELLALGEWIKANRPNDPGVYLSWGDARIGNMMFGADFRLAGVLDWDQMCLAHPRHDLAWWLYFDRMYTAGQQVPRPAGMGDEAETIALWEDRTGLKAGDLTWYEAYVNFKLALISMKTAVAAGSGPEAAAVRAKAMMAPLRAKLGF